MRFIPSDIKTKIESPLQTKSANADPKIDLWISRPTTTLVSDDFLEMSAVDTRDKGTKTSCAIRHTVFGRGSDEAYVALIQDGLLSVKQSNLNFDIDKMAWQFTNINYVATDCAIAFDGEMKSNAKDKIEFITDEKPWIFWTNSGIAYGRNLDNAEVITLAHANATAVSAVRAISSQVTKFDFGLCVFIVIAGQIFYRQFIRGIWYDAVPIPSSMLPTEPIVDVSAQRTWDYRLALQVLTATGEIYELYSQFEGIGSKNTEHIELRTSVTSDLAPFIITTTDSKTKDEHIDVDASASSFLRYIYTSLPVSAKNVVGVANNWGTTVLLTMTHYLENLGRNSRLITMMDENGVEFVALGAFATGNVITLSFEDFNSAVGDLTIHYTEQTGGIMSPLVPLESFTLTFTPTNLGEATAYPPRAIGGENV